jgi:hypothetical protein
MLQLKSQGILCSVPSGNNVVVSLRQCIVARVATIILAICLVGFGNLLIHIDRLDLLHSGNASLEKIYFLTT